jgi:hypothetical protein
MRRSALSVIPSNRIKITKHRNGLTSILAIITEATTAITGISTVITGNLYSITPDADGITATSNITP